MSMGDSLIRIVRADGMLWIGVKEGQTLGSPRCIMARQDGALVIQPIIGMPKEMHIPADALFWESTDEGLVSCYRENVSGLVMAKTMPEGTWSQCRGGDSDGVRPR